MPAIMATVIIVAKLQVDDCGDHDSEPPPAEAADRAALSGRNFAAGNIRATCLIVYISSYSLCLKYSRPPSAPFRTGARVAHATRFFRRKIAEPQCFRAEAAILRGKFATFIKSHSLAQLHRPRRCHLWMLTPSAYPSQQPKVIITVRKIYKRSLFCHRRPFFHADMLNYGFALFPPFKLHDRRRSQADGCNRDYNSAKRLRTDTITT